MARTKQTARKISRGKPVAMGRGKNLKPKGGGRVDQKVIIEYWSDESFDEERSQQVTSMGVPKRVKKMIHLTLPTNPGHVTTTESFTTLSTMPLLRPSGRHLKSGVDQQMTCRS